MIYLIGGSPRSGKSILSRKLAKKFNIGYVSTDNLRPVVMPYFPRKDKFIHFPFEKMFDAANINDYFEKYTGKQMLKADIKVTRMIWSRVKNMIDYLLKCKMDYIIEGIHLLPSLVKQYKKERNIKILFLGKLNENKIYKGLVNNKNNNDWITGNTQNMDIIQNPLNHSAFMENILKEKQRKWL